MKISKRLPVLVAAAGLLAAVSLPGQAQAQNKAAAIAIGRRDRAEYRTRLLELLGRRPRLAPAA